MAQELLVLGSYERTVSASAGGAAWVEGLMNTAVSLLPIPPKRILLVEDELVAARSISLALSVDGHTVDVAADGEQALAIFDARTHDLVLTDFKLPGMDGLELAEAIKQRAPTRPVILLTAYAEGIQGKVSNVDVLLAKPVSMARLHEAFRKVFNLRGSVVPQPGCSQAAARPRRPIPITRSNLPFQR